MRWYLVSTPQSPTHLTIASPWILITLLSVQQVCCETNCGDIDRLNSEPELMRMVIALFLKHLCVSLQINNAPEGYDLDTLMAQVGGIHVSTDIAPDFQSMQVSAASLLNLIYCTSHAA